MKTITRVVFTVIYTLLTALFAYQAYRQYDEDPWYFSTFRILLAVFCFLQLTKEIRKPRMSRSLNI